MLHRKLDILSHAVVGAMNSFVLCLTSQVCSFLKGSYVHDLKSVTQSVEAWVENNLPESPGSPPQCFLTDCGAGTP